MEEMSLSQERTHSVGLNGERKSQGQLANAGSLDKRPIRWCVCVCVAVYGTKWISKSSVVSDRCN